MPISNYIDRKWAIRMVPLQWSSNDRHPWGQPFFPLLVRRNKKSLPYSTGIAFLAERGGFEPP